jgi:hypothetical protein
MGRRQKHFASWLCESGETDYWNWMECRELHEKGDISVIRFSYHQEDETKERKDPARYGKFMPDNVIRTKLGRLTE